MADAPLRLATRASPLALAQAGWVAERLGGAAIVPVTTADGARGDKSRFVRGVEAAIRSGEADVAVHSAKDLPVEGEDGMPIVAVPAREDPRDALCGKAGSLDDLIDGARVGTSSLRRRAQLLALRPDLEVADLHGNIDTRLERLATGDFDGVVLAVAGLRRLERAGEVGFAFAAEALTPAPGQGALALQAATDEVAEILAEIEDAGAARELAAERAAVGELEASCETPLGVHAKKEGDRIRIRGFAGLPDGSEWIRDEIDGAADDPETLGRELAERMKSAGADDLLKRAAQMAATGSPEPAARGSDARR